MMDKELLELAAKAAGVEIMRSRLEDPLNKDMLVKHSFRNPSNVAGPWNPLRDDGDALRLAVTLGFVNPGRWPDPSGLVMNGMDWNAATRLAIVRAAAEIGRNLK